MRNIFLSVVFLMSPCVIAKADGISPEFNQTVTTLTPDLINEMTGKSWKRGCPVPLSDLRYIQVSHWGYDGKIYDGELVMHKSIAWEVVAIFEEIFSSHFPIEQMRLIDDFNGNDDLSMRDNNSSGFNCRRISGTQRWSKHAYGTAIDINPLPNPWVKGSSVFPPEGAPFVNRTLKIMGMIVSNDEVNTAFKRQSWRWGGNFVNSKDYQHFEKM